MAIPFPSEQWTEAYKAAVNDNPRYAAAGKDWTHGAVAMVVEADAELGIEQNMAMLLDVHEGACRAATYMTAEQARGDAAFVIEASYERWKRVIQGELDPIKAMMQGQLKLTKGHLPTIIRYVDSSRELVRSASGVDTEFPR